MFEITKNEKENSRHFLWAFSLVERRKENISIFIGNDVSDHFILYFVSSDACWKKKIKIVLALFCRRV